ncbi:T9SS type A sorting domain-containing protein [Halosquirtibacter xylanolyticus]|uniref:T9SS type A sorting domain-containing protein n=1 Tax=Halosquirtibacter xylanolyticus TaxID=3374599 RepID=UPI003747C562|nr:T9SS type A sorting domain-containing protein [Prolixibacteraceae bacterium]
MTKSFTIILILFVSFIVHGQDTTPTVHSFVYNGRTYEVIETAIPWAEAAELAVSRGGKLAEINSQEEQEAIYNAISNMPLDFSQVEWESSLWLGANDINEEGVWIWDGDNDGTGTQFFQQGEIISTTNPPAPGNAVDGLYNNWGASLDFPSSIEPDNYGDQDALAITLIQWGSGEPGQWNDIWTFLKQFPIIEYPALKVPTDIENNLKVESTVTVYPNPTEDYIHIENHYTEIQTLTIYSNLGEIVRQVQPKQSKSIQVDISNLITGNYILKITTIDQKSTIKKIIKK